MAINSSKVAAFGRLMAASGVEEKTGYSLMLLALAIDTSYWLG
jgi:hypothetical protein